jgi:integrase
MTTTVALTESYVSKYKLPAGVDRVKLWDRTLKGYGLIVGRRFSTFVVQARVDGKQTMRTVARHGDPTPASTWRDPEQPERWTEGRARRAAMKMLSEMRTGIDPRPSVVPESPGSMLTLRGALAAHVAKMRRGENRRRKVCSDRSIFVVEDEVTRHFAAWLDRPLVELDASGIEAVIAKVEQSTPRRAGSNPANPPGRALSNRLLRHASAIWNSVDRKVDLPVKNPARRLHEASLVARDTRIPDDGFAAWHERVLAMQNPVRRDLQIAALFCGVRSEGLRTLTWSDVDFDQELIRIARAKGDQPYTIPMTETLRRVLEGRQLDNATRFARWGGDHGHVFPTLTRSAPFRVIPIVEAKEYQRVDGERVYGVLGLHACRRTWNSVAVEIGCPPEVRLALMNHEGRGVNARHYTEIQNWGFWREWADRVEAALWSRLRGDHAPRPGRKRRDHLRAV